MCRFKERANFRLTRTTMTSAEDLEDLPAEGDVISLAYGGHNEDVLNKARNLLATATKHALVRD